jgi:hypothetical protein
MPRYEVEGQIIDAASPEEAYAELDRRERFGDMGVGEKLWSGVVDPLKEAGYGIKQLATGELSQEDLAGLEEARARRDAAGGWGTVGEAATWLVPFGAAGKLGAKAAQGAARSMLPRSTGRLAAPVGTVGGEAALESAYQASRPVVGGDPSRLERAATGAATGALGGVAGEVASRALPRAVKALGRPVKPSKEALRLEAQARRTDTPLNLTVGQAADPDTLTGGLARGVEEMARNLPMSGSLRRASGEAMANWNLSEIRDALPAAWRDQVEKAGPVGFEQLRRLFNTKYDEALEPLGDTPIGLDEKALNDLIGVENSLLPRVGEADRATVKQELENLLEDFLEGRIDRTNFKETLTNLRTSAELAGQQGRGSLANYYRGLHKTLNDSVMRNLGPDSSALYRETDAAYRRIMPLVKGGEMKGAVSQGYMTPSQMLSGAQRGQSSWGKATTRSPVARRARAADEVFGSTLPRVGPGTMEKLATQAAIGGLAGTGYGIAQGMGPGEAAFESGLIGAGAAPVLGGLWSSPVLRRALMGRTPGQRWLRGKQRGLERATGRLRAPTAAGTVAADRQDQE